MAYRAPKYRKDPVKYTTTGHLRSTMPMCPSLTSAGDPCPQRCTRVTIKGKKYKLKTCLMHASEPIRRACGVWVDGGPPNAGRKKKQTPAQVLRDRVEAEVERYLQPLEDALTAMKAVVVGNGASAHIEYTEDMGLRIDAVEKILNRVYGRPKQVSEISGPDGDAIPVEVASDEERRRQVAAILASSGALGTTFIPQNASASAPSTN